MCMCMCVCDVSSDVDVVQENMGLRREVIDSRACLSSRGMHAPAISWLGNSLGCRHSAKPTTLPVTNSPL